MPIYSFGEIAPEFVDRATNWIAPDAVLVGRIRVGRDVGIWFGATLRGDSDLIDIGEGSNVQEHTVIHVDPGMPVTIGKGCTIGHRAIVHGCTIGDNTLIGMGAIILNGARIGDNCLVGAGALVTEGKTFPDGSLIVGSPARAVRALDEAGIEGLRGSAAHYVRRGREFRLGMREV